MISIIWLRWRGLQKSIICQAAFRRGVARRLANRRPVNHYLECRAHQAPDTAEITLRIL